MQSMHRMNDETITLPKLFNSLDNEKRISSKWIAKETGRRHGNVLRDIENISKKLINSNLSQSINIIESIGYNGIEKECLTGLELAVIVLSHYQGKKAEQALALVYEALYYYMNRAPLVESELKDLKNQLEVLKSQKKIEKEKKSTYLLPIFDTDLFGNQYISRYEVREKSSLSSDQIEVSEYFHNDKIVHGLQNKNKKLVISFVGGKNTFVKSMLNFLQERICA